ncbi:GNAT family N-acetyltransferase [Actinorhabdospora filicis]|nr:GNAT family N-acetyltransferase [Actinorhabdospora filicis]
MFPVTLVGPRVCWREMSPADAEALHDLLVHPAVFDKTLDEDVPPADALRDYLREQLGTLEDPERARYKLALTLDGRVIGTGGIELRGRHTGEVGYVLAHDQWGKGLATEAAALLIDFAFDDLGLHRVIGHTDPANIGSRRVLEKCGLSFEGVHRSDTLQRGEWRDSAAYAIVEDDPRPWTGQRGDGPGGSYALRTAKTR